jgi:hypothetical protein
MVLLFYTMISNFVLAMLASSVSAQQVIFTDLTTSINKFANMVEPCLKT